MTPPLRVDEIGAAQRYTYLTLQRYPLNWVANCALQSGAIAHAGL